MLKFIARVEAKPGSEDLVTGALREIIEPSRGEPGCILYDVCRVKDDPGKLLVIEEWESQEALDEHMKTPHFLGFIEKAGDGLVGGPQLEIIERI